MPNAKTADYATLVLFSDDDTVAAGGTFKFTVAPTLKVGKLLYVPEATYKLFVRLPRGLKMQKVEHAPGTLTVVSAATDWTGAPGEYSNIPDGWEEGTGTQADAYKLRLLAEWKSSLFADTTNTHPLGWTITVVVDSTHDSTPAAIDATLIVMQDSHVKPALPADKFSVNITSAGPGLASVTLPEADNQGGQLIMPAATNLPIRIHAVLAQPAVTATMMVRWQIKGGGDLWNQVEPHELKVTGGVGGTQLEEFTIQNTFSTAVTLLFSCALPVSLGAQPNWGVPFSVSIDFEAALLTVDYPFIKVSSSKIILTCDIREPNAHVKFDTLEISFDDSASWQPIATGITASGTSYNVDHELTQRDFSHGALLRAKDKQNRSVVQPARFDAATFLSVRWQSPTMEDDDINLGEALLYVIHIKCALDTTLPFSTIDLTLPASAIEADHINPGWYYPTTQYRGTYPVEVTGWLGTGAATRFHQGLLQTGDLYAPCVVRDNSALLGQVIPAAQLSIRSEHFLVQPVNFTETPKAKVFRPAPYFEIVSGLADRSNKYAVPFKGNFIPQLEHAPDLVFTAEVDKGGAKTVAATAIKLTPAYFEFSLGYQQFPLFDKDGEHSVTITVHRSADSRAALRSSHSETVKVMVDSRVASFEQVQVQVESGSLRLDGMVVEPAADNPVSEVTFSWDGSGHGTAAQSLVLTDEGHGRSSFEDLLDLTAFTGTLHPVVKAFTKFGKDPATFNPLFSSARDLLVVVLKINGNSVNNLGNPLVTAGPVSFEVTVTSMVGLPQKLDMWISLGKSFSAAKALVLTKPDAGKGSTELTPPTGSWNGISSYQLLQMEGLVKGATFGVTGSMTLKKQTEVPPVVAAETLTISFTETDPYSKYTISPVDREEGTIFTVQLRAQ